MKIFVSEKDTKERRQILELIKEKLEQEGIIIIKK